MLRSKSLNYNRFNSKWSSEDEVSIEIQPIIDYCDALQTSLEDFITTVHLMMLNKYTNEDSIYTDLYHLNSTSHCYLEIKKGTHFNKLINQLAHSQNSNDLSYTFVAEKEISQDVLNKYQYIMGISFEVTDKNIKLKLYFQNPLIPQWYAKQYLQHFLLLLNEILKEDNRALDTINWNTDMDIKEIESFCNGPRIVFDFQTKLDEIFSRVATENSNSIAVVGYEGSNKISFTYKELNDRVNALALELQDLNVIENDPVVVHMERGIGVIISLLAIFKVGGVYIPIDTTYPEDYINYIIKDTGAK
ncbi:AMP-binding protein, partial [Bacillus cereus]|nr:AMP-binding protein [Bacillus cereus]